MASARKGSRPFLLGGIATIDNSARRPDVKYRAFVSFSHESDGRLARALESSLSRFAKPWYRIRTMRIFQDKVSLSANPSLWNSIEAALGRSEYLLLLASPASAKSRWVQRELGWWLQNRPVDRLIICLTDGVILWSNEAGDFDWEKSTAIPGSLKGVFPAEPLYADFRAAIENDFKLLRSATLPGRLTGHAPVAILNEVQRGFLEETDYINEGKNLEFFGKGLGGIPFLTIPKVHWPLTTDRVLTMSFVEGGTVAEAGCGLFDLARGADCRSIHAGGPCAAGRCRRVVNGWVDCDEAGVGSSGNGEQVGGLRQRGGLFSRDVGAGAIYAGRCDWGEEADRDADTEAAPVAELCN